MTNNMKRLLIYIGTILSFLAVLGLAKAAPVTELELDNTVVLRGTINWQSASDISMRLLRIDNNLTSKAIYLVLDSPGGSIVAGNGIIETMMSLRKPVICISMFAASMAHAILQACHTRYVTTTGISMIHRASGGFRGSFNNGEVESQLKFWKAYVQRMEIRNADRMSLTLEKYKKLAANEFWCEGETCVKDNFVDAVTIIRCSAKLLQSKYTVRAGYGIRKLSGCPLIRNYVN